jgi:hypothetical protein
MTVRKGNKVIAGGNSMTVDSSISATSPNPVQNQAIAAGFAQVNSELDTKQDKLIAGNGITIGNEETISVGNLDCGTM